jgi:hypothetical protein
MAFYLVTAMPKPDLLKELARRLARGEFARLRPFGPLTHSLKRARFRRDGVAIWEEEDYCRPPLAEERAAVLDDYFVDLRVQIVAEGAGWAQIEALPALFPEFAED